MKTQDESDPIKCCICGHDIQPVGDWRHGHNAEPAADGRCCDECNSLVVIPARIAGMMKRKKKMTFEEWVATERVSDSVENAENYFGYVPEGAAEILSIRQARSCGSRMVFISRISTATNTPVRCKKCGKFSGVNMRRGKFNSTPP